jgi:hypothetical protein
MGYEVKLYVAIKHTFCSDNWLEIIGSVDLSKPGPSAIGALHSGHKDTKTPPTYFFADDGNTKITEDRYGERISIMPLYAVVEALKKDLEDSNGYRRFKIALGFLEAFQDNSKDWEGHELVVVGFGH